MVSCPEAFVAGVLVAMVPATNPNVALDKVPVVVVIVLLLTPSLKNTFCAWVLKTAVPL